MKLDTDDRTVLELLGTEPRPAEALADDLDASPEELTRRLRELADNDLVSDLGNAVFRRTESGRRIVATSSGATDNRIDTSPDVERALTEFRLAPDEADAVRGSFAFLRYWGRATADEIIDAIFSEAPARFESADRWWTECVRDPLAALPGVVAPTYPAEPWRYAGPAEADTPGADGTRRLARRGHQPYGSVKQALESLSLSPAEREAVRAAFGYLRSHGEASERDIAAAVATEHPAGYSTPEAWWDGFVRDAFARLPGVTRIHGDVWRYQQRISHTPRRTPPSRERRS